MRSLPVFIASLALLTGCGDNDRAKAPEVTGTVRIEIGSPVNKQFDVADVLAGSTVEEILQRVSKQDVDFEMSGSGTTAFLNAIDGNGTADGKGWLFKIDGEMPERGIGATEIDPPAIISWTYGGMPQ